MVARKYTKEMLEPIVAESFSWAQILRSLGIKNAGGSYSHIQRVVKNFNLDHSHFTGQAHSKGKSSGKKKHWSEYLIELPEGANRTFSGKLRTAMIESGFVYQCFFRECPTRNGWINGSITFEIDHINGNKIDNRKENLRFVCPNCHSQQPTSSHSWSISQKYGKSRICDCGGEKQSRSAKCLKCRKEERKQKSNLRKENLLFENSKRESLPIKRKTKIDWPPIEELKEIVKESNYLQAGKILGVSDNAVRKHMRKF